MNTPGKILKAERVKKRISLEELSELLKIKAEYLTAIESDDYKSVPSETFVIGYIRLYAEEVGLDQDKVLDLYKEQNEAGAETGIEEKDEKKIVDSIIDKAKEIKEQSTKLLKKKEDE